MNARRLVAGLFACMLMGCFGLGRADAGSDRDSEIKKLKAENAKLKAENKALSKKPNPEVEKPKPEKECDRCLEEKPKPGDYAPNTTCRIDRTWRKVDEYVECYEWHSGRWWPVIVERWTWTDVKRCQTVTPR